MKAQLPLSKFFQMENARFTSSIFWDAQGTAAAGESQGCFPESSESEIPGKAVRAQPSRSDGVEPREEPPCSSAARGTQSPAAPPLPKPIWGFNPHPGFPRLITPFRSTAACQ